MADQPDPKSDAGNGDSDSTPATPPAPLSAAAELRQIFQDNKTAIWLLGLIFLGMFEPAARMGPSRTDVILGGCLAVAIWAALGWILMAPFTAIRRQGVPTMRQVLLAATILGVISVFGGVVGESFSRLVAS